MAANKTHKCYCGKAGEIFKANTIAGAYLVTLCKDHAPKASA